ncbi:tripartite tricarboxylate transporter substrate-binding protein [Pigmentiphaga kullae]|uniref:tripartite tricarboxylate transporter substrate-binding protein n=1 Tax=Pigmentiphaga kullae TaxID=151784 RepID=UPI00102C95E8|nr:tripartite tricarboxylate transporter substrate-binding protein [Pigmentiphaga kullae]
MPWPSAHHPPEPAVPLPDLEPSHVHRKTAFRWHVVIAATALAGAAPDGYTLMLAPNSTLTIIPQLYAKLPFDVKRLEAVALVGTNQMVFSTSSGSGLNDLAALVGKARGTPKSVSYGSFGNGNITATFDTVTNVAPQVQAGKLRALAVTGRQRSPLLPDTPTFAESGYPALAAVDSWIGLLAPAGMDARTRTRLDAHLATSCAIRPSSGS